jgi:hypothetical protein
LSQYHKGTRAELLNDALKKFYTDCLEKKNALSNGRWKKDRSAAENEGRDKTTSTGDGGQISSERT